MGRDPAPRRRDRDHPVVLWDEKAGAALEIMPGDVLEIIGRTRGKTREIYALALRKASLRNRLALQQ